MKGTWRKIVCGTLALGMGVSALSTGLFLTPPAKAAGAATEVALGSLTPTASSCQTFLKNQDSSGQKLGLRKGGAEVRCDTGLLTVPAANSYASVTFTDIQENGYEQFQADVGLHSSVRETGGEVEFRVYADGKQVYASGSVTNTTDAKHVSVDLAKVQVLQLVVDAKGSNDQDLAVWGDAHFTRAGQTPYLAVDDLEFNRSWQVTPQNILEYVQARDVNGQDIKDRVTYQTDYDGQDHGTFHVTYTAADQAGNTHTRTVNLVVTGEDYTPQLSLERLHKPWASYLYHGRGTLSTQGKKAWDLVLSGLLHFDASQWKVINRWGEDVYEVDVDLQAHGIYTTQDELAALGTMFMDDEPRTFMLKDWGNEVTVKDGLASHVKMWVSKQALRQDEWLSKIEANTQKMLEGYQPDMTEAQALSRVSSAYQSWLKYGGGGQLLIDSLGSGTAVCGGNARGYIYLSQRLGTKSVWGRSNSHAWSFTKLANISEWFKTDLLSGEFLAPGKNGEGNLSVGGNFKSRHYQWFVFGDTEYDRKLLRYPSVWVELSQAQVLLPSDTAYDLYAYVSDFGSLFHGDFAKKNIALKVDRVDADGHVTQEHVGNVPAAGNSKDLAPGRYRVSYTITDEGKTNTASLILVVTGKPAQHKTLQDAAAKSDSVGDQKSLGLWTGTEEKWYNDAMFIHNGGSVTFQVQNAGYKYLSFDFGIKNSVRENGAWGSYGKVAVKVEVTTADGTKTLHEGPVLGWKDAYESVALELPQDAVSVTIWSLDKGSGNGLAGIGALTFFQA